MFVFSCSLFLLFIYLLFLNKLPEVPEYAKMQFYKMRLLDVLCKIALVMRDYIAHRIQISEILLWDRKSYLTHAILPRLLREG